MAAAGYTTERGVALARRRVRGPAPDLDWASWTTPAGDRRALCAAASLSAAVLGGVVAIALIGGVLAQRGAALTAAFHAVAIAGALALAAGASIAFLFNESDGRTPREVSRANPETA